MFPQHEAPSTVASLVQLYFRRLPEPLLTTTLEREFASAARLDTERSCRLTKLRELIKRLPAPNAACLKALVLHMRRVADEEVNRMTPRNLSMCLMGATAGTLEALIIDAEDLFESAG
mmetsp:Transcript_12214/g.28673  ORF Transcript_12214/g.28673 Transcript_12214/m.28673 type:complete len:118 (+) Transcript_12214:906-1259(+)